MSGHTSIFSATEPPLSTVTETPTSVRHNTRALTFKHLNLEDKRTAVCLDMNPSIRIVPLAYFFDNVLPALHEDIDITSVIQTLQDSGVIEEERFQDFSSDPAQMPGHENIVFARLEKIVRDMVEAAETATLKPTMEFYHKGECSPKNATTPNKSRPDSFGLLRAMIIAGICWINIGFTGEVKKIFNDKKRHDVSPIASYFNPRNHIIPIRMTGRRLGACTAVCETMPTEGLHLHSPSRTPK